MEKEILNLGNGLLEFINKSPVSYYAVKNVERELKLNGYKELSEGDIWNLTKNQKFYIKRNDSSLIATELGNLLPWESGFHIIGSHTDSPLFKIKNESLRIINNSLKLDVEVYGGPIISTWLDRDLSIAGKVILKKENQFESQLIDFKRVLGTIPNLAIHLNRDVNSGFEYNKQNHLSFYMGEYYSSENSNSISLKDIVSKEFDIDSDKIVEMELFLYDSQKGSISGIDNDLLSSGRLDNLSMVYTSLSSIMESGNSDVTKVVAFFDSEEIGSTTLQGANSNFLNSFLDRIVFSLGGTFQDFMRARYHSFIISADGAHAIHPNFTEKHDPNYMPKINQGPVIKFNANQRYATTSDSAAYFANLCLNTEIPYQKIINRSDTPCGSTIGPMTSSLLGIKTVDVGTPMLAMHSIRETQGVRDIYYMFKVLTTFLQ